MPTTRMKAGPVLGGGSRRTPAPSQRAFQTARASGVQPMAGGTVDSSAGGRRGSRPRPRWLATAPRRPTRCRLPAVALGGRSASAGAGVSTAAAARLRARRRERGAQLRRLVGQRRREGVGARHALSPPKSASGSVDSAGLPERPLDPRRRRPRRGRRRADPARLRCPDRTANRSMPAPRSGSSRRSAAAPRGRRPCRRRRQALAPARRDRSRRGAGPARATPNSRADGDSWLPRGGIAEQLGERIAGRERGAEVGERGGRRETRARCAAEPPPGDGGHGDRAIGANGSVGRARQHRRDVRSSPPSLGCGDLEEIAADAHLIAVPQRRRLAERKRLVAHDDRIGAADVLDREAVAGRDDLGLATRDAAFGVGQRQRIGVGSPDRTALRPKLAVIGCVIGWSLSETARRVRGMVGRLCERRSMRPSRNGRAPSPDLQ